MIKKVLSALIFVVVVISSAGAQDLIDLPLAPRVDTTNAEVKAVVDLWQKHLSNDPDQIYDNPYWSDRQKERWHDYDISRRWTYGYELANGMNLHDAFGLKPRVLSVEKRDDYYAIKTLYAPNDLSSSQEIYSVQRVYAGKEDGQWKLFSALPILTEDWERQQIGDIRYVYPPDASFDGRKARESARFVERLTNKFDITLAEPVSYYVGQNYDQMAQISGLDYAWDGNDGRGYPQNNQVFVGTGSEEYPHELVHAIFKDYEMHPIVDEGLATYYGGMGGQSFEQLLQSVARKVGADTSLTLSKVLTGQRISSQTYYVGGAMLIKAAEDKDGKQAVKRFLELASNEEGIYEAMSKVLDVEKDNADHFWRQIIQEFGQ